MDGWISLHRKLIESEIWEKPPLYIKVWVFLLLSAQHSNYKGLKPGQVRTSIPEIIDACKWRVGARIERPTKDQIYQIIEWLRKPNEGVHESNAKATMITTTKATQGMLINISNYAVYQDSDRDESNDESNDEKATNPLRKQRTPNNINNNVNNNNNEQQKEDKRKTPKSPKRTYSEDDRNYKLAKRFHELAYENAVEIGTAHLIENPNLQNWANTFRLMIEKDKLQETEIGEVVRFALRIDPFYQTIIFSPDNLRKQYRAILTKMKTQGGGGRGKYQRKDAGPTQESRSNASRNEDLYIGSTIGEDESVSEELLQRIRG
ncbi:hypothetical protein [Paenibacillus illinoisensis]|uniref:hypothetical protein n=1 Tax=Paenibacillus illinoisensis TaxID=59845 RepID=UPI00301DC3B8